MLPHDPANPAMHAIGTSDHVSCEYGSIFAVNKQTILDMVHGFNFFLSYNPASIRDILVQYLEDLSSLEKCYRIARAVERIINWMEELKNKTRKEHKSLLEHSIP